ncbi:leukocyte elastase inhibitor-like [Acanthochromis polyacanthus]|uniref:leukocyte elastase inhibitor-like n=1 Tax=Acanthochromis polyacanthus TaxID=80966 RepID=UPI0022345245|nr:leukocyte elastase inhibitor-like [Acanthochromis polyacanthus]
MGSSTSLPKANTTFSLALFNKLSDDNKTANIFFSPFSISSAMAMVMLGARGNTAIQMSETLKFQDCQDDVHTSFGQLLSRLKTPGASIGLSVANRLYGEKSYTFKEDFLKQSRMHYSAELESVDFKNMCEQSRVKINSWMEKQTKGKIKDVLAKGTVNELTSLVLVNAIYFKGDWSAKFSSSDSRHARFEVNKTDTKPVMMMHKTTYFPLAFIPEVNCQILEMPYKRKKLSMLIFLPKVIEDDTTGLEKLEKQLTYETFVEWTHPNRMKNTEVDVRLPRFKMEETYDLENVLTSMGMVDAFDVTKSDFSGMSETKELVLSKVTHKAFVEVTAATQEMTFLGGHVLCLLIN